jgi:methylglutaconyl-CoA hydratase
MNKPETISLQIHGWIATVTLNRPGVRNALNLDMIRKLTGIFGDMNEHPAVRVIVLKGKGPDFSSGADLNWMRQGLNQSPDQLQKESLDLARLFLAISRCNRVVVAAVKGRVMGGANGLVAASDIAVAEESASFAFTEVRLGLVPATIAPYVQRKMGMARTSELMLTGRCFTAHEAFQAGLVQLTCSEGSLDQAAGEITARLLENGPVAQQGIKEMLRMLEQEAPGEQLAELTAGIIAKFRTSAEGQEGIRAFFEKRKPNWYARS